MTLPIKFLGKRGGDLGRRFGLAWGVVGLVGCVPGLHRDRGEEPPREPRLGGQALPSQSPPREVASAAPRATGAPAEASGPAQPPAVPSADPKPAPYQLPTANLDPADDGVVAPPEALPDCEERLQRSHVQFKPGKLPLVHQHGQVCGAPQAVTYFHGPEGVEFRPPAVTTCQLALGLARFEGILQALALEHLGERVKSVTQGGTYSCRSMARFNLASEHSYGNAIDLYAFTLTSGKVVKVATDFGLPSAEPKTKESRFLRALGQAAYDQGAFSVVVTRFFDELHRDHIHVDMAHYRTDGSR